MLVERGLKTVQPALFLHTMNSTFLSHLCDSVNYEVMWQNAAKNVSELLSRNRQGCGQCLAGGPSPTCGGCAPWDSIFPEEHHPLQPNPSPDSPPLPGLHCTGCSPEPRVQQVNK